MQNRELLIEKLSKAKAELAVTGKYHKRDLQNFIRRVEFELTDYDRFRKEAWKGKTQT